MSSHSGTCIASQIQIITRTARHYSNRATRGHTSDMSDNEFVMLRRSAYNDSTVRSQTLGRCLPTVGYMTCLLPKSVFWCFTRSRVVLGKERLTIQGLPSSVDTDDLSDEACGRAAGNAFCAWTMALVDVAFHHSVPMDWE